MIPERYDDDDDDDDDDKQGKTNRKASPDGRGIYLRLYCSGTP